MRNPNHYRFRLDKVWDRDKEITSIFEVVKAHYQGSFTEKCVTILHAVFGPLAVALQTNSVAEVRKAIEMSRDKVETFYDFALVLASSGDSTPTATAPEQNPRVQPQEQPTTVRPKREQPPPNSYDPPREKTVGVDSGSSAKSIYAGLGPDD